MLFVVIYCKKAWRITKNMDFSEINQKTTVVSANAILR